jgi:hypothetical protein
MFSSVGNRLEPPTYPLFLIAKFYGLVKSESILFRCERSSNTAVYIENPRGNVAEF